MTRFAEKTRVSSQQSRAEIERTLSRYGADGFMYGWVDDQAMIGFRMNRRQVKFILPMPDRADRSITHTPERNVARSADAAETAYEQAVRQRWRAMALVIKAKLEAVETGIVTFEDEFMSQIVLPNGQTVGQFMKPQIAIAYDRGDMPPLLPAPI